MAVLAHEGTYPIMYGSYPVPVGSGYRPGYLSRPDRAGRFPVIVIVPDVDGLSSFEKDMCRAFARRGIAALTLDMYRNRSGDPIYDYQSLSDRRALTDLDEVHHFLASDDVNWTSADAVGLMGLDVGGRFAIAMAATRPWVRSLAVCYTPLTGDEDREIQVADPLAPLPVPVLSMYGADSELVAASLRLRRLENGRHTAVAGFIMHRKYVRNGCPARATSQLGKVGNRLH